MNFRPNLLKPVGPNALAQEADFEIGALRVSPSRLEIRAGEKREKTQPRVMQVFVTMAGARGAVVSRDELIGRCWSGRIVGEDSISRCIAKVRDLANLATPPAFEIETIPRVGYRLKPAAPETASARPLPTAGNTVLAVLAFDNLSHDSDMAYFSDGVSEEILQTVTESTGLKVIGRSSSFQFRGADKAASRVAAALKVTHILDGAVRRSGSKVRITADLIECANETTLWAGRFDRELSDVFALQDEIAAAVAVALKVAFGPTAQPDRVEPAAYDLYLRALEIRNAGLEARTRLVVIGLLREATGRAPAFARAWAFLATMLAGHLRFDEPELPRVGTRAEVVKAAEAALGLDPRLGSAHQALGNLHAFGCYAEREALHDRALSVAPNDPSVLTNASFFFAEIGRLEFSLWFARRAYDIDPVNPWAANWYATTLDYTGRLEEGRALWDGFRRRWPDNELILWNCIGEAAARLDWAWFDELVAAADERRSNHPGLRRAVDYGNSLRERGPHARARELQRLKESLRTTGALRHSSYMLLARSGLIDEAFELIEQASFAYVSDPDAPTPNGRADDGLIFAVPHNSVMMRDVRFVGFCDRLGLCDYWVKTGNWPDCAQVVAPYYDFMAEARRLVAA